MNSVVDSSPVDAFIEALRVRNFDALQRTFADGVRLRALVPSGLRERTGAPAARELVQQWFGDADLFEVEYEIVETVADRMQASYRIRCRENGVTYVVEQHFFADTADGAIQAIDILCSGFRQISTES